MKYLLDTHVIFWAVVGDNRLPDEVLNIINSQENDIYFSSASVWEVVIKHGKNPQNSRRVFESGFYSVAY